jgi:hypothetical protein
MRGYGAAGAGIDGVLAVAVSGFDLDAVGEALWTWWIARFDELLGRRSGR